MPSLLKSRAVLFVALWAAWFGSSNDAAAFSPKSSPLGLSISHRGAVLAGIESTTAAHNVLPRSYHAKPTFALAMNSNNNNEVVGKDRILSCLPYLLPLLDGESYGRFLFRAFPPLGIADAILLFPFKLVSSSIPFFGLICFFGFTILARNPEIPRSVRFNLQQAVILDIILIFPSLFAQLGGLGGGLGLPRVLVESGNNFVFYCLAASVGYAIFSNATGKVPNQIPIVSEATQAQIGW